MQSLLIVDDDVNICNVLKEELTEVGFSTEFVVNADEALDYLQKNNVDVVLLDLMMPGKDGFHILREIQKREIKAKVIVLTGYADVKSAIVSARMGANDFVSKPYDFDELLITICKVLQRDS